jgi:outer membrane protein OmpA-like peptidoglycan-associated protein
MKKTMLSVSLLSILALAGCSNTTSNVVKSDDCCSNVQKLSIPDSPTINNRLTTFDVRPKEPEVVVIPSMSIDAKVLFAFDKSVLTPEGKKIISQVADLASRNMEKSIELTGSTDFFGTEKHNEKLAEKRAVVVRNEFIKNGVPANKIAIKIYLGQKEQEVVDSCKGDLKECVAPDRNTSMLIKLDLK